MTDKQKHEYSVCGLFLQLFNMNSEKDYKWICPGDDKKSEPDCICSNGLNIEVTDVYYSEKYAEDYLRPWKSNLTGEEFGKRIDDFNKRGESFAVLIPKLFKTLENRIYDKIKKAKKYVKANKLILVINGFTLHLDERTLIEFFKQKPNFKNDSFDEIWLLCAVYYGGRQAEGIIRLDLDGPQYTIYPESHHSKYIDPLKFVQEKLKRKHENE